MSKEPRKKNVRNLDEDDLFGDFKPIDEFIDSDSFDVTTDEIKGPGKFEIRADDQKKKPGHAAEPKKKSVEKLEEKDLFGNFKPIEEFIESDSFEVTMGDGETHSTPIPKKKISNSSNRQEDDLFGDFKPLDEFIESDSFEVTASKSSAENMYSQPVAPSTSSPAGGPIPPSISPISTPPGISSSPSSITPPSINSGPAAVQPPSIGMQSAAQPTVAQPEVMDETKSKLAEIAKRRKGQKNGSPARKGDVDGLFDDLDPLELDDN